MLQLKKRRREIYPLHKYGIPKILASKKTFNDFFLTSPYSKINFLLLTACRGEEDVRRRRRGASIH